MSRNGKLLKELNWNSKTMEEKNIIDFNREFSALKIPFKTLIDNSQENKELFFAEFLKAEKKPCFSLYLNQFYPEEERNKDAKEASSKGAHYESGTKGMPKVYPLPEYDKKLNELTLVFSDKQVKGNLGKEFWCPDITKTNTVKQLKEVEKTLEILCNYELWEGVNIHKEAEVRGESILLALKNINNPNLALEVLGVIIDDNENKVLTIISSPLFNKKIPSKIWDTWRALKANFNLALEKGKVEFINTRETEIINNTLPKSSIFKGIFSSYGFFELEKVNRLTDQQKDNLVMKLSAESVPYVIAMFNYLGFLKHLETHHFQAKDKLHTWLAEWLGVVKRTVKGNMLVLSDKSKEDRGRYTSHEYKSQVENDYKNIK